MPERSAKFAQKWHVDFPIYLVEISAQQQNLKRLKNREDGSDFDDFLTKSIASLQIFFGKFRAVGKVFVELIRTEISARPI